MRTFFFVFTVILGALAPCALRGQQIVLLDSMPGVSLRGLCPVNDQVIWASGSKGHVVRSTDGGKTFRRQQVPGFEKSDFRAIEAFDSLHAVIMSSGTPAVVLRTDNGGRSWTECYRSNDTAVFLDGMAWYGWSTGFVLGDPVNKQFLLLQTHDSGKTWQEPEHGFRRPGAAQGEAAFAASNSCIRPAGNGLVISTGGSRARVLISRYAGHHLYPLPVETPMIQGNASQGIFAAAFRNPLVGVIVGGDYLNDTLTLRNCYYTDNGGDTWTRPKIPPRGYRSSVEYVSKKKLVATGPSGNEISRNGGKTWMPLAGRGYHAVRKAKESAAVFFSGSDGRIGRLLW